MACPTCRAVELINFRAQAPQSIASVLVSATGGAAITTGTKEAAWRLS